MKPFRILLSALFAMLLSGVASATILTVHNDPLYNAQYNTIGAAVSAATAGDTLLVHGSLSSYGAVTLNEPLTIIGPGHDLANGLRAIFSYYTINAGAAGTVLEGINFGYVYCYAPSVVFKGCLITQFMNLFGTADGSLVTGCVLTNAYCTVDALAENVEIRNNYFSETSTGYQFFGGSATTLVHHNVFARSSTSTSSANKVFNASSTFPVFADNVFYTATVASFNPDACPNYSFQSNLSYSTAGTLPSLGANNLDNVVPTWELGGDYPTFDYAHDYNMLSGAPLTGASDGGQVGAMGGTTPFVNAGLPRNIPRVTSTELLTPYVPVDGTIDVNFQAEQGQP